MEDPLHPEAKREWAAYAALLGEFLDHLPWEGRRTAVGLLLLGVSALPEPDPQALGRWVLQEARRRKSPHAAACCGSSRPTPPASARPWTGPCGGGG